MAVEMHLVSFAVFKYAKEKEKKKKRKREASSNKYTVSIPLKATKLMYIFVH